MKTAWFILLVSAATDGIILMVTGLTSAMMATGSAAMPNKAVLLLNALLGLLATLRTIQQTLKAKEETATLLLGIKLQKPPVE